MRLRRSPAATSPWMAAGPRSNALLAGDVQRGVAEDAEKGRSEGQSMDCLSLSRSEATAGNEAGNEARTRSSALLLTLRSRFLSSKSINNLASKTRQEAGSKEEWGPLWSAEERSDLQGKASMFEHRDVRVAQRPARREHRREPRVHDAHGARKWGGLSFGDFSLAKQRKDTRPTGRNALALALDATSKKRQAQIAGRARSHRLAGAAQPHTLVGSHAQRACNQRPRPLD